MKMSEFLRLASKNGCRLLKHKTRHDLWVNPAGETFLIPRHTSQELAKGLELSAREWAGLE